MERNCDLNEFTDGKRYGLNDMVKAECNDCKGCSACCRGMGNSIVLDPLDVCRLQRQLGCSFEQLIAGPLELNVVEGMILPNIKMSGEEEKCTFLNEEGRCSIHKSRPGICRIFPLGRIYEDNSFSYILQVHECKKENRTKIKVNKWIDTPNLKENQQFINDWHYFIKEIKDFIRSCEDESLIRTVNMFVLKTFYMTPFENEETFYTQFNERLAQAKKTLQM